MNDQPDWRAEIIFQFVVDILFDVARYSLIKLWYFTLRGRVKYIHVIRNVTKINSTTK